MDHEIPVSQKDRNLPMIINLRGDEDLLDEFTWDADQVMEFLGIKRSRLTQISGKELRVARVRRDRYLRPIYRECDVKDYQEWTRATATHQSSSRAIEQAIDSLDDRFSDLIVVVQEKLLQFEDRSSALIHKQLHRLDQTGFERFQSLSEQGDSSRTFLEHLQSLQEMSLRQLRKQSQDLSACQDELQALRALLGNFHQDLRALLVAQNGMRREVDELREILIQQTSMQAGAFESIESAMQELRSAQQRMIQQQSEYHEPAAPRPPKRNRLRRPLLIPAPTLSSSHETESTAASPQSSP